MHNAPPAVVLLAAALACAQPDAGAAKETVAAPPKPLESTAPARSDSSYTISAGGVGPIRLGMTLDEARRALPAATFKRSSDGEGAALVEVTLAPDTVLHLWAGEEDAGAALDWSKPIRNIETFSAAFHTAAGVHPGSLVTDVERIYGRTREITLSEIESREYIQFETQPPELLLRLDHTGVFRGDGRTTTEYKPGAKILSIAVTSR